MIILVDLATRFERLVLSVTERVGNLTRGRNTVNPKPLIVESHGV
jgi:hypothetical protein